MPEVFSANKVQSPIWSLLKENYTDDKLSICTEVIIEQIFIRFIQNMAVFIKRLNKN